MKRLTEHPLTHQHGSHRDRFWIFEHTQGYTWHQKLSFRSNACASLSPLLLFIGIRSNATLRVKLWDWNLSIPHDPLGHVEVHIGDELLSKKVT